MMMGLIKLVIGLMLGALWLGLWVLPGLVCLWILVVVLQWNILVDVPILGLIFIGVVGSFCNREIGFPDDLDLFRPHGKFMKWYDSLDD